MNIQQHVHSEETVNILRRISNAFQYGSQREKKGELSNDTARVHTKPRIRSNPNIHFSWSLATVLLPPKLAFSPTSKSHCSAIKSPVFFNNGFLVESLIRVMY